MSTSCFNASLKPFAKWQYCFINWALWQVRPDRLQDGLQLRNVRWLRYIALILVKHRTLHMIVKRVEIRRILWPLFLPDKLWAISAKPVLRQWRCVRRSPVLLELGRWTGLARFACNLQSDSAVSCSRNIPHSLLPSPQRNGVVLYHRSTHQQTPSNEAQTSCVQSTAGLLRSLSSSPLAHTRSFWLFTGRFT